MAIMGSFCALPRPADILKRTIYTQTDVGKRNSWEQENTGKNFTSGLHG